MTFSSYTFQYPPLNGAYHRLISGVDTRYYIYSVTTSYEHLLPLKTYVY